MYYDVITERICVNCLGVIDYVKCGSVLTFRNIRWQKQYSNLDRLYQKLLQRPSFIETEPPAA